MKKNFTLFKTLLVAVGLCVGSSAWADTENVFTQNFTKDGDKTAVTDYGFTIVTENNSSPKIEFTDSNGKLVLVAGGNSGSDISASAKASFTAVEGNYSVNFSCTWSTGNATGTRGYSRLILANAAGNVALQLDYIGGDKKLQVNGSDVATNVNRDQTFAVTATLNLQTQQIIALTIGNAYTQSGSIAFKDATATTISALQFTSNAKAGWTNTTSIDNIVITKEVITAAYTKVTFKYEDMSGNSLSSLKADVEQDAEVGATVSELIGSTLTTEFKNNDESVKYTYNTFSSTDATVQDGGTTVVTLKFNANPKFTYTIKAVDSQSNDLGTIASVSGFTGETLSLYWSKYIKSGDKWYVTSTNSFYKSGITEAGSENVTYAESDIDYFIECENMNGVRTDRWVLESDTNNSGYRKIRINNYYPTIYTDVIPEGGVFTLSLPYNNGNSTNHTYQIRTRDANGNLTDVASWTSETGSRTYTLANVVIPSGHSLAISCDGISGNSNARMDYLTLTRTGDATVSKTITAAGWATYYSPYPLDFTESGLTAYIVTGADGAKLDMQEVTAVPAKTAVLLKGVEGGHTINVVGSADAVSGNVMKGVTEATVMDANTIWVLMNDDVNGLGFYCNSNAFTVGANTAYIPADEGNFAAPAETPGGAKARFFALDGGNATAINGIESEKNADNAAIYNLAGQRVNAGYKGIVIKNGKKYMNK